MRNHWTNVTLETRPLYPECFKMSLTLFCYQVHNNCTNCHCCIFLHTYSDCANGFLTGGEGRKKKNNCEELKTGIERPWWFKIQPILYCNMWLELCFFFFAFFPHCELLLEICWKSLQRKTNKTTETDENNVDVNTIVASKHFTRWELDPKPFSISCHRWRASVIIF